MEGHFATGRLNTTVLPGRAFRIHHNQRATALARSKSTGGSRGSFVFRRGEIDFFGGLVGGGWGGISRPGDGTQPFRPVAPFRYTTINKRPR